MLRNAGGTMVDLRERRAAFDAFFEENPDLENRSELAAMAGRARSPAKRCGAPVGRSTRMSRTVRTASTSSSVSRSTSTRTPRACASGTDFASAAGSAPGRSRFFLPFLLTGAAHRGRQRVERLRWQSRGV